MASLADAEDALRSTTAKANFQRLTRLLMCGGLGLLRETFDSIHSPVDLPLRLADAAIQTQLRGARLTRVEWDCLYPSPGVYGKSTDFDITLIFRLLRTICNLTPPPGPRGWDDLPNSSDHSLEADLVRIKYYRNEVYGHSKTMEIADTEFDDLWGKISEALIRIAASKSHEKKDEWKKSIDDFLDKPLTPEGERYIEELNTWYKQDMDVKTEVEKLTEKFETLAKDIKEGFAKQSQRPTHMEGPVAILVVNTIESITRAGSPVILNYLSGRPQIPHEAGESQGICVIPVPDQERAEDVSDSEELQLNPLDTPPEIHIWTVILSFKKSFELFLQYLGYKLNVFVRNLDVGSLLITVECSSLQILEGLWEDYRSGHLDAIAQEMLVTAEVLEKLGLTDVKLKSFISEEEYEKGKQIFMDHLAISEQSHLPPWKVAGKSGSLLEAAKDTVSEFVLGDVPEEITTLVKKGKDIGDGPPEKSEPSTKSQHRNGAKKPLIKVKTRRKRAKKPGSGSSQGHEPEVNQTAKEKISRLESDECFAPRRQTDHEREALSSSTSIPIASSEDYLERISNLEKENSELKRRVNAIENALQGKKESRKIDQLEKKNIKLEKRLVASENARERLYFALEQLKYEVHDLEQRLIDQPFRAGPYYRRPWSVPQSSTLASVSGLSFEGRKGFCQVIVNRQKLEVLVEEKVEFKSVFEDLGFFVNELVCQSNFDVELVITSVAKRDYSDYNSFVCFIQSSVTKDWEIESSDGRSLSVTKLIAKFSFSEYPSLQRQPKIFIIQGRQTTTALETDADEPLDEKSFSVKLPLGENFLCLFVPYRKGYISTLLSVIKLHGSKGCDILDILSEAKKLFYEKNHIIIPDPVHNFTGPVYLTQGTLSSLLDF